MDDSLILLNLLQVQLRSPLQVRSRCARIESRPEVSNLSITFHPLTPIKLLT